MGGSDDLALALELADLADSITLPRFGAADLRVQTKADLTPVTEADQGAEHAIRERLGAIRPGDVVVGEEYGSSGSEGSRHWIVDPIDGTKSFVRGNPTWASLIALREDGEVTVGVVSAPAFGRRWWAARGGGAFVDDGRSDGPREIRVSGIGTLGDATVSFGDLDTWVKAGRLDRLLDLASVSGRARGFGDFWSYMLLAEGALEIGLDPIVAIWDLAAPLVIVEEAGGRFTDFGGVRRIDGGSAIASNGLLHEGARAILD